jgi:hypothetical protein
MNPPIKHAVIWLAISALGLQMPTLAMAQLAKLAQYRAAQQAIGQAGVAEQARFAGEARGFHRLTPCDETERPGTGPGPAAHRARG